MMDILITKHRDMAFAIGTTDKGKEWLKKNTEHLPGYVVRIPSDLTEEFRNDLVIAGLEVDIK